MGLNKFISWGFLTLLSLGVYAQIGVKLHQPPPNQLRITDLWWVDLTNPTDRTYKIYLHGEIKESKKGLVARANSNDLILSPGINRIKANDITEIKDRFYLEEYEEIISRTGQLPAGDYTICIYVIDVETKKELGSDCIHHVVQPVSPPRLLSPTDKSVLREKNPLFTWVPPSPLPPTASVSYTLRICEVKEMQSKEEAVRSNVPWFEERNLTATNFRYPVSAKSLEENRKYVWQIRAFDRLTGFPIGESEVWEFKIELELEKKELEKPAPPSPPFAKIQAVQLECNPSQVNIQKTGNILMIDGTEESDCIRLELFPQSSQGGPKGANTVSVKTGVKIYVPATSTTPLTSVFDFDKIKINLYEGNDFVVFDASNGSISDYFYIYVDGGEGNDIILGDVDLKNLGSDPDTAIQNVVYLINTLNNARELIDSSYELIKMSNELVEDVSDVLKGTADSLILPSAYCLRNIESKLVTPTAEKVLETYKRLKPYVEENLAKDTKEFLVDGDSLRKKIETIVGPSELLLQKAESLLIQSWEFLWFISQYGCERETPPPPLPTPEGPREVPEGPKGGSKEGSNNPGDKKTVPEKITQFGEKIKDTIPEKPELPSPSAQKLLENLLMCKSQITGNINQLKNLIINNQCPEDPEPFETVFDENLQDPLGLTPQPCAQLEQIIEQYENYLNSFFDDADPNSKASQTLNKSNSIESKGITFETNGEALGDDENKNSTVSNLILMGENLVNKGEALNSKFETLNDDWEKWVSKTEAELDSASNYVYNCGGKLLHSAGNFEGKYENLILKQADNLLLKAKHLEDKLNQIMQQAIQLLGKNVFQNQSGPCNININTENTFKGGQGNDYIFGTADNDSLIGEGGKDLLVGKEGDDLILGGDDEDLIFGGSGADQLHGGPVSDILIGNAGNDCLFGEGGKKDTIFGIEFRLGDLFFGSSGNDRIISGDKDNDTLNELDLAWGGDNDDKIQLGDGSFFGDDTVTYFKLGNLAFGGNDKDTILTQEGIDIIFGENGNDKINTGKGYSLKFKDNNGNIVFTLPLGDLIFGGIGDDNIDADDPNSDRSFDDIDVVFGGDGNDVINVYGGDEMEIGSNNPFKVYLGNLVLGGNGNDDITALDGIDVIFGDDGDDKIKSGKGYNLEIKDNKGNKLFSLPLGDLVFGGGGNDNIDTDDPNKRGNDDIDIAFGGDGNDVIRVYSGGEMVIGSQQPFRLRLGNLVFGGNGNDDIASLSGIDVIFGEEGNDKIQTGEGSIIEIQKDFSLNLGDFIFGQKGNDILHGDKEDPGKGEDGIDLIFGGEGNDRIYGGAGGTIKVGDDFNFLFGNLLFGGPGNDFIRGDYKNWKNDEKDKEGGLDLIFGGTDNDTIQGSNGGVLAVGNIQSNLVFLALGNLLFGGPGNDRIEGANRAKAGNGLLLDQVLPDVNDLSQCIDTIGKKFMVLENKIQKFFDPSTGQFEKLEKAFLDFKKIKINDINDVQPKFQKLQNLITEVNKFVDSVNKLITIIQGTVNKANSCMNTVGIGINTGGSGELLSGLGDIGAEIISCANKLKDLVNDLHNKYQTYQQNVAKLKKITEKTEKYIGKYITRAKRYLKGLDSKSKEAKKESEKISKTTKKSVEDLNNLKNWLGDIFNRIIAFLGAADLIFAGTDNDYVQAFDGIDLIFGSKGDDNLNAKNGGIIVITIKVPPGVPAPAPLGFGNLIFGGDDKDNITSEGRILPPIIQPPLEIDLIFGNKCNDVIDAGDGFNIAFGGKNDDKIAGKNGINLLFGNSGDDSIITGGSIVDSSGKSFGLNVAFGNKGNDVISGGQDAFGIYVLFGNKGKDNINGGAGLTVAFGNQDDDKVWGGPGLSLLFGNKGSDDVKGGSGLTVAFGNKGNDKVSAGPGLALLFGNNGNDKVSGSSGICLAFGGNGHDILEAGTGANLLFGNQEDDRLRSGSGFSVLFGNNGSDVLEGSSGILFGFGNDGGDVIIGGNNLNIGFGNQGQDQFFGGNGESLFIGGRENDVIRGGSNNDLILGNDDDDYITGGAGGDLIFGNKGDDVIGSGNEGDIIFGNRGNDNIYSEDDNGNDFLFGNRGNDNLYKKQHPGDKAFGGRGNDNKYINSANVSLGLPSRGEIYGRVMLDLNGDGIGDVGHANIKVNVGTGSTWTDEDGFFRSNAFSNGTYSISQTVPSGFQQVLPSSSPISIYINKGYELHEINFVNKPLPGIMGVVFKDENKNGIQDPYEPGLQGWKIEITDLNNNPKGSGITDNYGYYYVSVSPGDYIVKEIVQSGWVSTTPNPVKVRLLPNGKLLLLPEENCPELFTQVDFGNYSRENVEAELCIIKFHDLNGNGKKDSGEPGIEGWDFDISGIGQKITGADGKICFKINAGKYTITEGVHPNWTPTTPHSQNVTINPGQQLTIYFGNKKKEEEGKICIIKFNDLNGNGQFESYPPFNETPLSGWTFNISGVGSVTTNKEGKACVNVKAGTYTITEVTQSGFTPTTPNPQTVTVQPGQTVTVTFGNKKEEKGCIPPPSGLVGWWPLDETPGNTFANDIAGAANKGSLGAGAQFSPSGGKVAGALMVSGQGPGSIRVPNHPEINVGTGDFTIDLWVKTTWKNYQYHAVLYSKSEPQNILNPYVGYTLYSLSLYATTISAAQPIKVVPNFQIAQKAGSSLSVENHTAFNSPDISDGNWHHIAVVCVVSNKKIKIFVDGNMVYQGSSDMLGKNLNNEDPVYFPNGFGIYDKRDQFTGYIDEVELFKRALTDNEIKSIYNADKYGKCK